MSASSKKKLRKEQETVLLTEKQLQEKKEAKKLKTYTIIFALVMAIVIGVFAWSVISKSLNNAGVPQRLSTALEVNGHTLNAAELSYFYTDSISEYYNEFYNYYGNSTAAFLSLMGLDVKTPLNAQSYDTEGKMTWADYFGNVAMDKAAQVYALVDAAQAEGFTLSEEDLQAIDDDIQMLEAVAPIYGFSDAKSYLKGMYGNGATEESFRKYLEDSTLAQRFYDNYAEKLTYTDADYREHEKEHFDEFSSFTFDSFLMNVSAFYQGGTQNENGTTTYSDEEKAAALKACESAVDLIKNSGATTAEELNEAIAALPIYADNENAVTSKSDNVSYSNVATEIQEWLCEDGRKAGDLGILPVTSTSTVDGNEVTTTTGYYLVIFQEREDNNFNLVNVRHILVSFEGGTTDSTTGQTVYTEAEKLAAKKTAEDILAKYNETAKAENDFTALVKDNSDDTGSVDNGGLYEDVYPGQMVEAFNDWCFAEGRKAGDTDIVETEYGYHVMYFVGEADITYRDFMIKDTLTAEDRNEWLEGLLDSVKLGKKDISKLKLDYVISPSTSY